MPYYNDFIVTIAKDTQAGFCLQEVKHRFWVNNVLETEVILDTPLPFHAEPFLQQVSIVAKEVTAAIQRQSSKRDLIHDFGSSLFQETFKDTLKRDFNRAQRIAGASGFRIRLQLPPELQELPWELMYRTDQNPQGFLCRNPPTVLVRSDRRAGQDIMVPTIQFPLRILVIVAAPFDLTPLDARKEIDHLLSALTDLIHTGRVQVDFVHGADTLGKLLFATRNEIYHIWHFIGHGEERDGAVHLALEDDTRRTQSISPLKLYAAFEALRRPRLVFLNVCQGAKSSVLSTSIADSLLQVGIPAVIAHRFEISYEAAEVLAKHLYHGLANGVAADEALALARQRMAFDDDLSIECHTPVLFLHNASGELFPVPVGTQIPVPNLNLLIDKAQKAVDTRRWSEATDYAQEALIIQPEHAEILNLRDTALQEERLDRYLHEVRYEESYKNWAKAVEWYDQYRDDPAAQRRPSSEREQITRLRQVAQAGAGVLDPWFKWKG